LSGILISDERYRRDNVYYVYSVRRNAAARRFVLRVGRYCPSPFAVGIPRLGTDGVNCIAVPCGADRDRVNTVLQIGLGTTIWMDLLIDGDI